MVKSSVKIFDEIVNLVFNKVISNDVCVAMFLDGNEDYFYLVSHIQQCCEDVWLNDYCGNLSDLENSPITIAEMVTEVDNDSDCTWSFVKIGTVKGMVVLRFCGISNGYYSEEADIFKQKTLKKIQEERELEFKQQEELTKQWEDSLFN